MTQRKVESPTKGPIKGPITKASEAYREAHREAQPDPILFDARESISELLSILETDRKTLTQLPSRFMGPIPLEVLTEFLIEANLHSQLLLANLLGVNKKLDDAIEEFRNGQA